MAPPASPTWDEIQHSLRTPGTDIRQLYKALFCLKNIVSNGVDGHSEEEGIDLLLESLGPIKARIIVDNPDESGPRFLHTSKLFRHECCYVLGQLGANTSNIHLKQKVFEGLLKVLMDCRVDSENPSKDQDLTNLTEDEVTAHEAAEGIAAVFNNNVEDIDDIDLDDIDVANNNVNHVPDDIEEKQENKTGITVYLKRKLREVRKQMGTIKSDDTESNSESDLETESDEENVIGSPSEASTPSTAQSEEDNESGNIKEIAATSISKEPNANRLPHFRKRNQSLIKILQLLLKGDSDNESETSESNKFTSSQFNLQTSPLAQTLFLAIEGLKRDTARVCACQYSSYDPAIGIVGAKIEDVDMYEKELMKGNENESQVQLNSRRLNRFDPTSFYPRYVAMFTLRNLSAVASLARCLDKDNTSPVLRHEIAFILGQIDYESLSPDSQDTKFTNSDVTKEFSESHANESNSKSENDNDNSNDPESLALTSLIDNLDSSDHPMVRHESAIALGSIGGDRAKSALKQFTTDKDEMVAESCIVALDTIEYWEAWNAEERRIMGS